MQHAPFVFSPGSLIAVHQWSDGKPVAVCAAEDISRIDRNTNYPVEVTQREYDLLAVSLPRVK